MRDLTASAPQAHRSRGITPTRGAPLPDPAALILALAQWHRLPPSRPSHPPRLAIPAVHVHPPPRVHLPGAAYHDPLGLIGHVRGVINRATDAGGSKNNFTSPRESLRLLSLHAPTHSPPLLPRRGSTRSPAGAPRQPSPPPARGFPSRLASCLAPGAARSGRRRRRLVPRRGPPRSPRFGCERKVIRRGARELAVTAGLPLAGAQSRVGLGIPTDFLPITSCRFGLGHL